MRFRPCIDLHKGKVKQIVGASLIDNNEPITNFETDRPSSYYANLYKEHSLYGGHVIMLGPGNESAALEALRAFPQGLQIGGGITPDNAHMYLDAGASHVIVTSYVFKNGKIQWDTLEKISLSVGKERLVLDLSCKFRDNAYWIVTDRWQYFTDVVVSQSLLTSLAAYCDEFLVHAADVEGKVNGIELELVKLLSVSPIPITYAGGIRSTYDLDLLYTLSQGKLDFTIGSALDIFGGNFSFTEVIEWCKQNTR